MYHPAPGPACLPCWSLDWELARFHAELRDRRGRERRPRRGDPHRPRSGIRSIPAVKEAADPATFGLTLRDSAKDYFLQTGTTPIFEVEHDGAFNVGEAVEARRTSLGIKSMEYPQPDSRRASERLPFLNGGGDRGASRRAGHEPRSGACSRDSHLAENAADALQAYVMTPGISHAARRVAAGARTIGASSGFPGTRAPVGKRVPYGAAFPFNGTRTGRAAINGRRCALLLFDKNKRKPLELLVIHKAGLPSIEALAARHARGTIIVRTRGILEGKGAP